MLLRAIAVGTLTLLLAAAGQALAGEEEIQTSIVFGSEAPGPYKHPASITELANGDLYLVYYGGSGEYGDDTAVFGSRRPRGSDQWTTPVPIADTPFKSEGNGVVWQAPDGLVWLFYVVRYGETWSTSRIQAKISRDGAKTWSDPMILAFDEGMMVRGRPIALHDGDYLLPIYHETGHDTEMVGPDSTSLFLRYEPSTGQWVESSRIHSPTGNIQPAVAQITDDYLVAYCRRGGDYEPTDSGYIVRAESHDAGQTWSEGRNSQFPNPNSAVDFIKLENGHLLLVYNDSMNDRTPLTVAISTDQDRSYPHRRNIAEGDNSFAYPTAIQTSDGRIHVIYTTNDRTVIRHAHFAEEAILSGGNGG